MTNQLSVKKFISLFILFQNVKSHLGLYKIKDRNIIVFYAMNISFPTSFAFLDKKEIWHLFMYIRVYTKNQAAFTVQYTKVINNI